MAAHVINSKWCNLPTVVVSDHTERAIYIYMYIYLYMYTHIRNHRKMMKPPIVRVGKCANVYWRVPALRDDQYEHQHTWGIFHNVRIVSAMTEHTHSIGQMHPYTLRERASPARWAPCALQHRPAVVGLPVPSSWRVFV